jgi:hypothetical protein
MHRFDAEAGVLAPISKKYCGQFLIAYVLDVHLNLQSVSKTEIRVKALER